MLPEKWVCPCRSHCTKKYAVLTEIPWRIYCKKGCNGDTDTWEECLEECDKLCYKDPVLKDHHWSAHFDRSPGIERSSKKSNSLRSRVDDQSIKCFSACASGCGYKFNVPSQTIEQVHSNRPPKPPLERKPSPSPECVLTTEEDTAASVSA